MASHLVGVFNNGTKGCIAECGQCGDLITGRNENKVKRDMTTHYDKNHSEHTVRYKRYDWDYN